MDLQLAGKSCLVTGASTGIGRATAQQLAREGARVLVTARSLPPLQGIRVLKEEQWRFILNNEPWPERFFDPPVE